MTYSPHPHPELKLFITKVYTQHLLVHSIFWNKYLYLQGKLPSPPELPVIYVTSVNSVTQVNSLFLLVMKINCWKSEIVVLARMLRNAHLFFLPIEQSVLWTILWNCITSSRWWSLCSLLFCDCARCSRTRSRLIIFFFRQAQPRQCQLKTHCYVK